MADLVAQEQVVEDYEKIETVERLRQLRKRIRPYFKMLSKVAESKLEKMLTGNDDEDFPEWSCNAETISQGEELLQQSALLVDRKREQIKDEWSKITERWLEVKENEDLSLLYSIMHPEIEKALSNLNQALIERSLERDARIKSIAIATSDLRNELTEVWDACHVYEEDKAHFMNKFTSQNFSEDLYEAHRAELAVWRGYQKKNRALMDKLARRQQMWSEMVELEAKAVDPSRFANRGAALLKDQNNLTSIRKHLPKVEEELLRLATKFSIDHGRAFKIHGKEIMTLIEDDWAKFREEKTKKKFERNGSSAANGPAHLPAGVTPGRKRPAPSAATPNIPYKK